MKEQLLYAGFVETQTHTFVLQNTRFRLEAWTDGDGTWVYKWKSLEENVGGGPWPFASIGMLKFYL